MKPICTPFTYLNASQAKAISAVFGKTVLMSPFASPPSKGLRALMDEGIIEIQGTSSSDDVLNNAVREYQQWAELHSGKRGGIPDFMMSRSGATPFFDELSTARIHADIRKNTPADDEPSSRRSAGDQDFNVRLFLALAQNYDEKMDEVQMDLDAIQGAEATVLKDLTGEVELPLGATDSSPQLDPGGFMTVERVKNWADLFLSAPVETGIFITPSRAVAEYLLDDISGVRPIVIDGPVERVRSWRLALKADNEPVGLGGILEYLVISGEQLPNFSPPEWIAPEEEGCLQGSPRISIWLVEGISPQAFFQRFVENDISRESPHIHSFTNTVVGLIQT